MQCSHFQGIAVYVSSFLEIEINSWFEKKTITVSPRLLNPGLNKISVTCILAVKRPWSLKFLQMLFS
jgi:hypothetical protein